MPFPFTGHKMFCAGPNILCQTKNWTVFSATPKSLWLAQYVNQFLVWHKKFGPAQNILRPVEGRSKNAIQFLVWHKIFGTAQNILGPVKEQSIFVVL